MPTLYGQANPRDLDRMLIDPPDPASIMLPAVALIGLGVTMIYSASAGLGGAPATWQFWRDPGLKQLLFVPPALFLMWLASHVPYTFWRLRRPWLVSPAIIMAALVLVLLVGVLLIPRVHKVHRWIPMGSVFELQPSELAKVALVLLLAALIASPRFKTKDFVAGAVPVVIVLALFVLPIWREPDKGTAILLAAVAGALVVAGGVRVWHMLLFAAPAGVGAYFAIMNSDYARGRITGANRYQINQALMGIASGGWFGRGLGDGIEKWGYLPQDSSDFIFAMVCEELGMVGGLIVIGLFIMLLWQLRRAMAAATDTLGQLIVLGVMLTIGLQAAMNVAVATDFIPQKGIALPFVSAGGSGLIIMSIALGLAASVARTTKKQLERDR